jgi:putative toxin-antitoxin system antitoxin component (TIGR02293 family)
MQKSPNRSTRSKAKVGETRFGRSKFRVQHAAKEENRSPERYLQRMKSANTLQKIEFERNGVPVPVIKELSRKLNVSAMQMFNYLGIAKATATKKERAGENVTGSGGHAAIGMVELLVAAEKIVSNSTAEEARGFDTAAWLGRWIERPQAALGGRRPMEFLDTPGGAQLVMRLLTSIESGSYQ